MQNGIWCNDDTKSDKQQCAKKLIEGSLTNKINDREMCMKGIDYSYYYEEND